MNIHTNKISYTSIKGEHTNIKMSKEYRGKFIEEIQMTRET